MVTAEPGFSAPAEGEGGPDLEAGIAAIFTRLRDAADGHDVAVPEAGPVDDSATYELLGELDRLWRGDA
ncbi:MAG TPA: hypothetical protein VGN80_14125 [Devosiaceae bacterium]|jgi:hypothetical protein|nr:hypothetical protein [Devosiaceae bacterium]